MKLLDPAERAAAVKRIAEISAELGALPTPWPAEKAGRVADLQREYGELARKIEGIGPPRAGAARE